MNKNCNCNLGTKIMNWLNEIFKNKNIIFKIMGRTGIAIGLNRGFITSSLTKK